MASAHASSEDPGATAGEAEATTINALPPELVHRILLQLDAVSLGMASSVATGWHVEAARAALENARHVLPNYPAAYWCPRVLRLLHAAERLTDCVGPRPASRTWRDEWEPLRFEMARLLARHRGEVSLEALELAIRNQRDRMAAAFKPGGNLSIENETRDNYGGAVAYKVASGWREEDAICCSLLVSRCGPVLAEALCKARPHCAASAWALCDAMWERTWAESLAVAAASWPSGSDDGGGGSAAGADDEAGAPLSPVQLGERWRGEHVVRSYAALDGEFGLSWEDDAWASLKAPGAAPGLSFVTRGFPTTMIANANSFPIPPQLRLAELREGLGFPKGLTPLDGFHVPVMLSGGRKAYELANSDVVCFIGRRPGGRLDAAGKASGCTSVRSLIPTDEAIYRMPPFVTVTLEGVREAGCWGPVFHGFPRPGEPCGVQRRLYEVSVEY